MGFIIIINNNNNNNNKTKKSLPVSLGIWNNITSFLFKPGSYMHVYIPINNLRK